MLLGRLDQFPYTFGYRIYPASRNCAEAAESIPQCSPRFSLLTTPGSVIFWPSGAEKKIGHDWYSELWEGAKFANPRTLLGRLFLYCSPSMMVDSKRNMPQKRVSQLPAKTALSYNALEAVISHNKSIFKGPGCFQAQFHVLTTHTGTWVYHIICPHAQPWASASAILRSLSQEALATLCKNRLQKTPSKKHEFLYWKDMKRIPVQDVGIIGKSTLGSIHWYTPWFSEASPSGQNGLASFLRRKESSSQIFYLRTEGSWGVIAYMDG